MATSWWLKLTHLKNLSQTNWIIYPTRDRGRNKKCLKPPPNSCLFVQFPKNPGSQTSTHGPRILDDQCEGFPIGYSFGRVGRVDGWLKMDKFWRLNRTGNHSASHSHNNKVNRNHPSKIPTSMETKMEVSNLLVSWFDTDLRDLQPT